MENNVFNPELCQAFIDVIRDINVKLNVILDRMSASDEPNNLNEDIQDAAQNLDYKYLPAKRFFTGKINNPADILSEQEYMKIFAAAYVLAAKLQQQNPEMLVLPQPMMEEWQDMEQEPETLPIVLASDTHDSLTRAKTAVQEAAGEITAEQAWEAVVDRTVARAQRVASKFVDKGVDWIAEKGTRWIERVCPKAKPITTFVRNAAPWLKEKGKKVINAGIKSVGNYVKKVAPRVVETAKTAWNKLKAFGKAIFS